MSAPTPVDDRRHERRRLAIGLTGDTVIAPLSVSNAGTLAHRYSVVSTTTENALAAQLGMTIETDVTTCTTGGFNARGRQTGCSVCRSACRPPSATRSRT